MAKNQKDLAESVPADESGGWLTGFLADEGEFDRRTLWRLGSWGAGSVGAVIVALLAHNSGTGLRHQQIAAADLGRQSQQIQSIAKASENEVKRLSSAIDTLNGDRDRLFARVTVLEQGLDSVTGSISRNVTQKGPRRAPPQKEAALDSPPVEPPLLPPPDLALPTMRLDPPTKSDASNSSSTAGGFSTEAHPSAPAAFAAAAETAAKPSPADSSSADSLSANTPSTTSPSANSSSTPAPPGTDSSAATATPVTPEAASKPATAAQNLPATRPGGPDETAAVTPATSEPKKNGEPHKSKDAESKDAQIVVASIPAVADAPQAPSPPAHVPVEHTDFGVDLGSARSIKGLRTLWHGILKSNARELESLYPIIVLKERGNGGRGMQLRLVAGPLSDAAAAAKICAVLSENGRTCETAVFDGQRLDTKEDGKESGAAVTTKKPGSGHASSRHRHGRRSARAEEPTPPPSPAPPPPKQSTFGAFFSH